MLAVCLSTRALHSLDHVHTSMVESLLGAALDSCS